MRLSLTAAACVVFLLSAVCGCDGEVEPPEPTTPTLDEGWVEIQPGGETGCARATPFSWWIHGGTQNKLVIDFFGGGACWNDFTCSVADAIFEDSVDPIRNGIEDGFTPGIYDRDNPENPVADWYHAVVPYCTGDVHWGNSRTSYGTPPNSFGIDHVGAVNARAVLDWVFANFSAPEQVLVTGCSAGSYGSVLWSAEVMRQYPEAEVIQFGDSGAGVITEQFFQDSFPSWGAEQAFPSWIPDLDPDQNELLDKELADLYAGIGEHYPQQKLAQFNTRLDGTQVYYFDVMGGGGEQEWSDQMLSSIAEIEDRVPNFCSFTAPGDAHCVLPSDRFYTMESDGIRLVDWLADLVGGQGPESVVCADCSPADPGR